MSTSATNPRSAKLRIGVNVDCLYQKGGNRNILKHHNGQVKKLGYGPSGVYFTIQEKDGSYRSLSQNKTLNLVIT